MENPISLVPLSSPESLNHRANLAHAFTSLRMVRPRVSFWKLAAHRIPTLWILYRGLLKEAPTDNIRWRMQMYFRVYRHIFSPKQTRVRLQTAHKWLDTIREANNGNNHFKEVLLRYDKMIVAKFEKERMKQMIREAWAFQERLRSRPILTGGYIRATLYNKPLPRMKPQPDHITMMIKKRRLARERRGARYALLAEWLTDLRLEARFEEDLARKALKDRNTIEDVFRNPGFRDIIQQEQKDIRDTFSREMERVTSPIPYSLHKTIVNARREKISSKTHERLRERRGEVLKRTIRRMRKMPPAWILRQMTPERRRMDRVVRSISEVGYVRDIKLKLGFKLKDNTTWMKETGDHWMPLRRRHFLSLERWIRIQNMKRRLTADQLDEETQNTSVKDDNFAE